ncbi:MAG TPA: glutamate-cysteine ligase family protein [Cyclobacteriaceae bacterium]|nr:glutamate-cysteine ligase family protein [Cyclobacteriaceae bacterium]
MSQPSRFHLFQAFGVELEYMLVDKTTLAIKPVSDELLKHQLGVYGSDYENGVVTWSNELVLHVVELKSTRPEINFNALENAFAENVNKVNAILDPWNAMLLPTAAHPLMDPNTETKLWPHDSNEVYAIYDRIFNCKGHGWSNLQSTHLNLPFYDDEEFAKLHAAVRIVLPILPALCASSPILDGKTTGKLDTRLEYYKTNQQKIPSITGRVIPEGVFSKRNYINTIYEKIKTDISPHDPANILDPVWVNSRGAIPRFDRGSIEIRIMDIQECPSADLAIITLVIDLLQALVGEKWISLEDQMKIKTDTLVPIFDQCVATGRNATIDSIEFLKIFGLEKQLSVGELWRTILDRLKVLTPSLQNWEKPELETILNEGSLSERILRALDNNYAPGNIQRVYHQLSGCLAQNRMFIL